VLLYCADYDRRNDLAFLLRVRCTWARFETFHYVEDMDVAIEDGEPFDVLVLALTAEPASEAVAIANLMRHPEASARAVEVRDKTDMDRVSAGGRKVPDGDLRALVEAMWMASWRKRGPKRCAGVALVGQESAAPSTKGMVV
jgi:hypothetical protein